MLESDMYLPIKEYLERLDYTVKAEVRNLDVLGKKDDLMIVVEMKKQLSLKLLYQGCDRQRMFDNVYLAIFDPGYKKRRMKAFKEKLHILHRLRLGLMVVDVLNNKVEVLLDPKEYVYKKNNKKKNLLLDEFANRKTSLNKGGVSKIKIMTAYKEQVIEIAKTLVYGPLTTKEIRKLTQNPRATQILYINYYKWFRRVERGKYELTELGHKEINQYI
ncbi:MAG: hypothetical protein JEZ05_03240 [Tenericutes bacterium]|nr:hypothetical protein [Mycoplasmatota bacterium]